MSEGLEYNGAVLVGTMQGTGIRATTTEEREAMIVHHDNWNECMGDSPILPEAKEDRYLVEGSRGVCLAYYHQRLDGAWVFQDAVTGDDEGMRGYCDEPFSVERWMPLPKGKNDV